MFNGSALAVAVTGLAYFWMKYALTSDDPFAVVNHQWQPLMLKLHVVASPIFILAFGIILNSHVLRKLGASGHSNRKSGWASFITLALMVGSGYLLPVSEEPLWIQALVAVHVASGSVFVVTYGYHLVATALLIRRSRARSALTTVRGVEEALPRA